MEILLSMKFIKIVILYMLFWCTINLFGCATRNYDVPNFRLPNGYELVKTNGNKFKVKTPDGNLASPEWLTEEGAINYAITYDYSNKQ